MSKTKISGDLHKDHRERFRQKYLASGFDGFADHEVLELLLFYAIPRKNTNDTAHLLMNRFRSFSGVLNASVSELEEVPGVGEASAVFLNMMPKLFARYELDRHVGKDGAFDDEKIRCFLRTHYLGESAEHSVLMLFDGDMCMIEYIRFDKGASDHCDLDVPTVAEYIFSNRAECFALAHNHPSGPAKPSPEDIAFTDRLKGIFGLLGKPLINHYIVTPDGITGIC